MAPRRSCHNVFFVCLYAGLHLIVLPLSWTAAAATVETSLVQTTFAVAALLATVIGAAWAYVLRNMIRGPGVAWVFFYVQSASAIFFLILASILIIYNRIVVAIILLGILLGDAMWFKYTANDRLRFVERELELVGRVLLDTRSLAAVLTVLMSTQLLFFIVWGSACARALAAPSQTSVVLLLFLFVSLLWTTAVLKHIATTVIAVATTAWLSHNANVLGQQPPIPVDALTGGEPVPTLRGVPYADSESDEDEIVSVLADVNAALRREAATRSSADMSDLSLRDIIPSTEVIAARSNKSNAMPLDMLHENDESSKVARARGSAVAPGNVLPDESSLPESVQRAHEPGGGFVVEHASEASVIESTAAIPPSFPPSSEQSIDAKLWTALFDSSTCSIGSIAAGALLGVFSPVAWPLLHACRHVSRMQNHCLARAALSAASLLRSYLRLANKYTFVLVGTKRLGWFPAARQMWLLMTRAGLEALVADDVSDRLLLACCYVGGSAVSILLFGFIYDNEKIFVILLILWCFGYSGVSLPLAILDACVSTLIVSFSQLPEVLSAAQPLIYHRFLQLTELELLTQRAQRSGITGGADWQASSDDSNDGQPPA